MSKVGVKIDADTRGFRSGMDRAGKDIDRFKQRVEGVQRTLEGISKIGGILAIIAVVVRSFQSMGEAIKRVADENNTASRSAQNLFKVYEDLGDKFTELKNKGARFYGELFDSVRALTILAKTGSVEETAKIMLQIQAQEKLNQERRKGAEQIAKQKEETDKFIKGVEQLAKTERDRYVDSLSNEEKLIELEKDRKKAQQESLNFTVEGERDKQLAALKEEQRLRFKILDTEKQIAEEKTQAAKKAADEEKKRQETIAKNLQDSLQAEWQRASGLMQGIQDEEQRKQGAGLQFFRSGQGAVGGGRNVGLSAEQLQKQTEKQAQMQKELQKSNELLKQIAAAIRDQKGGMLQ